MKIVRTEYPNVIKEWSCVDIRDFDGRLLKSVNSQAEASAFLKEHFYGDENFGFACGVRVEFNGCVGYTFMIE